MKTLRVGDRVRIHPASDWFMRGVTQAVVTSRSYLPMDPHGWKYVLRPDTLGLRVPKSLRIRVPRELLLTADKD